MKRFTVPLINTALYVYHGPAEWEQFIRTVWRHGAEKVPRDDPSEPPGSGCGRAWGGWLWVDDITDRDMLAHELSHVMDNIMDKLGSHDGEFRAHVSGWVISHVTAWADAQRKELP